MIQLSNLKPKKILVWKFFYILAVYDIRFKDIRRVRICMFEYINKIKLSTVIHQPNP